MGKLITQGIIQTGGAEMWLLLLILLGIGGCVVIMLGIFSLVSAGRKADEGEERILELISLASRNDIDIKENTPVQTSEVALVK